MLRYRSPLVFGLLILNACGGDPCPRTDSRSDEMRIRARYASMDSLFALDSMEAIAGVYSDTARIVTGRSITTGRSAIAHYWGGLRGRGISWDHAIEALTIRGDRAIQHGTSQLLYQSEADTILSHVRYTVIWVRDAKGEWWIDLDHYTQAP